MRPITLLLLLAAAASAQLAAATGFHAAAGAKGASTGRAASAVLEDQTGEAPEGAPIPGLAYATGSRPHGHGPVIVTWPPHSIFDDYELRQPDSHGPVPGAPKPTFRTFPSLREQAAAQEAWLKERLEVVLPTLLDKYNVDMWIMSQREYGEDTVFFSMKGPTTFAARRRTLTIFQRTKVAGKTAAQRYSFIDNTPQVWSDLKATVQLANPSNIVLNIDDDLAFSDGLHAGEREILEKTLGPEYLSRVIREPRLAVDYIATRVPGMGAPYRAAMETVHAMIAEVFSDKYVVPSQTTTEDLVWAFRERIQSLNFTTWFHPSVDFRRQGTTQTSGVILPGDLLHVDVGIIALGLCTDTQHMAYVLKPGERQPPAGLQAGLTKYSNVMQDIVRREIKVGRTGNEIFFSSIAAMKDAGIQGTVYSHPIGDWGHSAGPLIGYSNIQTGVPVKGDLKVVANSWYSVELQADVPVPEWNNQIVSFRQEEDIYIDENGENHWVYGRQERLHLIKPRAN